MSSEELRHEYGGRGGNGKYTVTEKYFCDANIKKVSSSTTGN